MVYHLGSIHPTGSINYYPHSSPPDGWLMCNGDAISRTTYSDLFSVIGTLYGSGDGSTTFNLPNIQERVPVGAGGDKTLGNTGGSETRTNAGSISSMNACGSNSHCSNGIASHWHPVDMNTTANVHYIPSHGRPYRSTWNYHTYQTNSLPSGGGSWHTHGRGCYSNVNASFSGNTLYTTQSDISFRMIIKL